MTSAPIVSAKVERPALPDISSTLEGKTKLAFYLEIKNIPIHYKAFGYRTCSIATNPLVRIYVPPIHLLKFAKFCECLEIR